ncbi:MAG: GIY-YIG nuclease family protein, partial [Kiritimatiellaeota bacterium]|nr:GIY-YIG nuclease family protein [Kiritimatiellota bacterium]
SSPDQTYIGFTEDVRKRLAVHNSGGSVHTAHHRPWALVTYVAFREREQAIRFEKYLKSGSGQAFAERHLW